MSSKHAIQVLNEEIAYLTNQREIYADLHNNVTSYTPYQKELLKRQVDFLDKNILESQEQRWVVTQLLHYSEGQLVMQERSSVDILQ